MIVTYNWLREFVDFDFSAEELSHRLTMVGLEVDAMEKVGDGLDSVIVARLENVEPHPDADRLTLCRVDTGEEVLQVVCGARNHRTGDLVALARVGTVLPGDFRIKASKIRGQQSQGMLCSEKELGLAEESEGILILPPGLPLGRPVFEALGLKDVRYEIGLTPNRPDCLSVVGVAREVAAMVGRPLRLPRVELCEEGPEIGSLTSVTIDDPGLCPRYAARMIRGVRIGPSPDWLVRRLESVGQRSINNVVDVTNLVLMELGHPLHAFDFHFLKGGRIVVRRAGEGERLTTLDGQERTLSAGDLTIRDRERAVALAGIMGGENSEIRDNTADILLESAYFNPPTIRRTSKRLGIHSESSHRFERGADIDMVPVALDRAAALILEVAGGELAKGAIDVYPAPAAERKITLTARRTCEILGLEIDALDIKNLLNSIGLRAELAIDRGEGTLYVTIPAFRPDLEREIDLIEEVARLNGFDRIPVTMPVGRALCHQPPPFQRWSGQVRDAMVGQGFNEVINYAFVSPSAWDRIALPADDPRRNNVRLLNPLTEEQSVMRTTLVPSLLETVARNLSYRTLDLRLFEMRPVFLPQEEEVLPRETLRLTAVISGRRQPEGWAQEKAAVDFFDLKGVAELLFGQVGVKMTCAATDRIEPYLHPGQSGELKNGDQVLGVLGALHPRVAESFGIAQPIYLLDLDLTACFSAREARQGMKPLSRFPDVCRDSAFLLDEEISAAEVFRIVNEVKVDEVEEVVLFDLYCGPGIPPGKKSIAIRVRYRSRERTLTDEDISLFHGRVVEALRRHLGAEIR